MKKLIIIITTIFLITGCNKKVDLVKYESDLLDINFSEYVLNGTGEVETDYALVTFEIKESKLEDLRKELTEKLRTVEEEEKNNLKKAELYQPFKKTCNNDNIELYHTFQEGKKIKTRDIYVALCSNENKYYFIING